jgi:hypothetical protein
MQGKKMTFEEIEVQRNTMNLGELLKLVKDFGIPLTKLEV